MILFRNILTVMILHIMSFMIPSIRQQFQDYFLAKIESFVQFYTSALLRSAEPQDSAPNTEALDGERFARSLLGLERFQRLVMAAASLMLLLRQPRKIIKRSSKTIFCLMNFENLTVKLLFLYQFINTCRIVRPQYGSSRLAEQTAHIKIPNDQMSDSAVNLFDVPKHSGATFKR